MLWVMFLSVGFFGIKGGIFTVLNAGSFRVWGPPESFIEDNNHLATALLMILPIGIYLMREIPRRWGKWLLGLALFFILVSVVGSYSRGAFLAIIAVAFFLWWKSRRKGLVAMMVLPLLPIIFLAMPEGWHARMETITNYQEDYSAMGRLNAWEYAINAANARLFGAGMESWSVKTFAQWAPNPADVHAAHSIYFSVLADHGWPGLVLFVAIFWMAWRTASRIIVVASRTDGYGWMSDLARMLQVSFVAYAAGGAFLSLSYFDLPWHLVCLVVIMRAMLEDDGIALTQRRVPLKQASSTRGGME